MAQLDARTAPAGPIRLACTGQRTADTCAAIMDRILRVGDSVWCARYFDDYILLTIFQAM